MENKYRIIVCFIFIFLFFIQNAVAQDRPVHRITWDSEYALQYEIIIQRQVSEEDYEDFYNDFTQEKYIDVFLPPGQYRFQIIPYDMLEHPGEPSYWAFVNVQQTAETEETEEPYEEEVQEEEIEEVIQEEVYEEEIEEKEIIKSDFWFGISADSALYTAEGFAYGGGLTMGYGKRFSFGLKAAWFLSTDDIDTVEINALLRTYFFSDNFYHGPFIQVMGGISYSFPHGEISIISDVSMISAGAAFGWRILLSNYWYIEPYIRGGYPYMGGAGLVFGFRHGEKGPRITQINTDYEEE